MTSTQKAQDLWQSIKTTVFIFGTALTLFAAARNSLTWHLENFWGASHDLWQTVWISISQNFLGGSDLNIFVLGLNIFSSLAYAIHNCILIFIDLTGKPKFLTAYKIQEEKNVPVDKAKLKKAILVVTRNSLISFLMTWAFLPLFRWRGMEYGPKLPSFPVVMLHLSGCILIEEFGFYYSHRLLHHPKLYQYVHKVHHEWTAPIGITALYAHPIEHIISTVIPVLLAPTLIGCHAATMYLWVVMALCNSVNSHSGYHFPGFPSPEQHDYHHLKFNQCYGVLGILDRLHNTDGHFRASKNYQRHITFFDSRPIKQIFPDPSCAVAAKSS